MTSEPTSHARAEHAPGGRLRKVAAAALTLTLACSIAGCGASGTSAASIKALKSTCRQIEAALSNGPEPAADPVGYAEAQVRPLRQIHTSQASLEHAIKHLASAYDAFYLTQGAKRAGHALSAASRAVEAICPGAAG